MCQVKMKSKLGIKTQFYIEKFDKDNNVLFSTGPFHNLMLEHGLNNFHKFYFSGSNNISTIHHARSCAIGTGTSEPARSQTSLANYFTSTRFNEDSRSNNTYADPQRIDLRMYYQFEIGTFNGENITELGLFCDEYEDADHLINRQLTRVTSTVTDEELAVGDGVTTNFTGSLSNSSCDPNTLIITTYDDTDTLMTLQDDGEGNLTGDGSGTIIYDTGAYDITFNSAPKDTISIYADYEWQEATAITVQSDEGLRIYVQMLVYAEAELDIAVSKGPFTFEDLTDETSDDITYTQTLKLFNDDLITYTSLSKVQMALVSYPGDNEEMSYINDSITKTLTTVASGGPKYTIEGTWNPGTFTGDISTITVAVLNVFDKTTSIAYEISLDTPITSIVDTEEIKFTFEFEWGEV